MCQNGFCLYAEDAGIFGQHGMFHDYLEEFDTRHMRKAVIELFQVLDTKPEDRDPYIEESLAQFPYVMVGCLQMRILKFHSLRMKSEIFYWKKPQQILTGQKSVRLYLVRYLRVH